VSTQHIDLPETVRIGCRVTLELLSDAGEREQLALDVVPDSAADFASGFLGVSTPLAQAILGLPVGSIVPYRMADIVEARVIAIEPSTRAPAHDAAAGRIAATQEAVERSKREDIVRLALTVNVKWGGYDPAPLEPPDE
jgi:hypothetical protein